MFQQLLARTAAALDEAGISYMVIGGQAVLVYGEPRFTRDVDVTVLLPISDAPRVADTLAAVGLEALEDPHTFVRETFVLPFSNGASGLRLDLLFGASRYEQAAVARARSIKMHGLDVRFISPEDLIIHKVLAGRPQDLNDVLGVLLKQPDIDRAYIDQWLQAFDAELDTNLVHQFEELLRRSRN